MRALLRTAVLLAAAAAPATLLAQQGPSRSVDDYVCAFTDECADGENAATEEAASSERRTRSTTTRGFSLSRKAPGASNAPAPANSNGRASTSAKATPTNTSPERRRVIGELSAVKKAGVKQAAVTKPAASKKAASAARRVDLRLSFETGSATLTEAAKEEARVFAEALRVPKLAERKFVIEGHTDSVGGRAYNLELSRRRAQAVADYLASLGVDRSRLRTVGYGFDRPLDGRSARAEENRRVEAVLAS